MATKTRGTKQDEIPAGDAGVRPAGDEDSLVLPAAWRRVLHPRRGGIPGPAIVLTPPAGALALIAAHRAAIVATIGDTTDATLADQARVAVDDLERASPVGAAAVAMALKWALGWTDRDDVAVLADAWWTCRGPEFAAMAAVELSGLSIEHDHGKNLLRRSADGWFWAWPSGTPQRRVRALLSTVDDKVYARVCAALLDYRGGHAWIRCATSYLVPTQDSWVAQDLASCAAGGGDDLSLYLSGRSMAALAPVLDRLTPWQAADDVGLLATFIEGVGAPGAPVLASWFDRGYGAAAGQQRILAAIALLPTDEAMRLLIDRIEARHVQPALVEAARRFPVRATRLLAAAAVRSSASRSAGQLLRAHVLANPAAVALALPLVDAATRAQLATLTDATRVLPDAPPERLPAVLVSPPWLTRDQVRAPAPIVGLTRPDECAVHWAEGEREAVLAAGRRYSGGWTPRGLESWPAAAELIRAGQLPDWQTLHFFLGADTHLGAPLIANWQVGKHWEYERWLSVIIARYGVAAHPVVMQCALRRPAELAPLLMHVASSDLALLVAGWAVRLKSVRTPANAWLLRHPDVAARALVPDAVGKAGAARRAAEQALRTIAAGGGVDAVTAAAKAHGPSVAAAIDAVLSADPMLALPTKMPAVPAWADPGLLPPVRLRDGSGALPRAALGHLNTMLAISAPEQPYPGLAMAAEACYPGDLAEYAWALLGQWRAMGFPVKEGWVLDALGWLGDDETVRRLAPLIRVWPGDGGHHRAVAGLRVLATIGTDVALMHLHRISQRVKFKALKDRAAEMIGEVAERLALTPDELADRLVPDLGLDAAGTMRLDYGPRTFTVGFDEQLRPYVSDLDGRRKVLPKPGAKDDPELSAQSYQRFSALKKDVRVLAGDQIARLEAAMVTGRRWRESDFRALLVGHPLLSHIVRRLVWATFDDNGAHGFRVAEDGTFADVRDETLTPADDAMVGVAHPLHLGDTVAGWSEVLADYEILQPFTQLGRSVYALTEAERGAKTLDRFAHLEYQTVRIVGLESHGWRRGAAQDAGVQRWLWRPAGGGRAVVINLEPGIPVGMIAEFPDQKIEHLWVNNALDGNWSPQGSITFAALDPVLASEILRDLTEAAA